MIGIHKIIDCEVVFAIEEPGTTTDYLFAFDHAIHEAHQPNVANVALIYLGCALLACGNNCSNCFLMRVGLRPSMSRWSMNIWTMLLNIKAISRLRGPAI